MAKKDKGGRIIKVDGSKMQGGGASARVPEDDYKAKVVKIESKTSSNDNPMLVVTYEISEGKHKGKKIKDNIMLMESGVWRLRMLLEAMGKKVPDKMFNVNIDKLIGEEVAITAVDGEPYKGRVKSEVADIQSTDILDADDEDEDDEDDDDDEDDEDEDLDEVDVDEEL